MFGGKKNPRAQRGEPTCMNPSDISHMDKVYRKPTDREVRAYAKRLMANDRELSFIKAMETAREHVLEHLEAHLKNIDDKPW